MQEIGVRGGARLRQRRVDIRGHSREFNLKAAFAAAERPGEDAGRRPCDQRVVGSRSANEITDTGEIAFELAGLDRAGVLASKSEGRAGAVFFVGAVEKFDRIAVVDRAAIVRGIVDEQGRRRTAGQPLERGDVDDDVILLARPGDRERAVRRLTDIAEGVKPSALRTVGVGEDLNLLDLIRVARRGQVRLDQLDEHLVLGHQRIKRFGDLVGRGAVEEDARLKRVEDQPVAVE
ncbi:hypothetical protein GCM10008965_16890 [Methylorubrum aminovorans]